MCARNCRQSERESSKDTYGGKRTGGHDAERTPEQTVCVTTVMVTVNRSGWRVGANVHGCDVRPRFAQLHSERRGGGGTVPSARPSINHTIILSVYLRLY